MQMTKHVSGSGKTSGGGAGFTLIELVFVIVLLALLSSVTIPAASSVLGVNLRTAATQVAGYLRHGYEQSVMKHERIRVRFDFASNTYWAETYEEAPTVPLLDENAKLEETLDRFDDLLEQGPLTPEEQVQAEQERYKKAEGRTLKVTELPGGTKFKGVYVASEGKVVDQGAPWVEFSPGGFAPKTIVYVTNNSGNIYSIILRPIGGQSRIERGEVRPDEV